MKAFPEYCDNIDLVWYEKKLMILLLAISPSPISPLFPNANYLSEWFIRIRFRLISEDTWQTSPITLSTFLWSTASSHSNLPLPNQQNLFFLSTKAILFLIHFIATLNLFYRMKRTLPWSTGATSQLQICILTDKHANQCHSQSKEGNRAERLAEWQSKLTWGRCPDQIHPIKHHLNPLPLT